MSDGIVDLNDVIQVMRENGVSVELDTSGDHPRGMYIVKHQGKIEAVELPKQVRRRMVQTIARKCNIDIRLFYFRERGETNVQEAAPGTTTLSAAAGDESQNAPDKPNGVQHDSGAGS